MTVSILRDAERLLGRRGSLFDLEIGSRRATEFSGPIQCGDGLAVIWLSLGLASVLTALSRL
jgi:hypothetical protein